MATFISNDIVTGTYCRARIVVQETAVNVISNYHDVDIYVQMWRTNSGYTTYGQGTLHIGVDGQGWESSSITSSQKVTQNSYTIIGSKRSVRLYHDSNGNWSANVYAYSETNNDNMNFSTQTFAVTLTPIDRAAPSVTASVSNITASSFTISASTNADCDIFDYSLNNGSTWTRMSSILGKSAAKSITGLTPNTTYNVKVKARRSYNQVYGNSSAVTAKTLGNSLLNSISTVNADTSTVVLSMNWTIYAAYTHTLQIKNGNTTVLTLTNLSFSVGTNNITITLTTAQRRTLLEYMETMKSFTGTFYLTTYSGSTQIGSTVSKTALIQTTAATSAPTFSTFTHRDKGTNGTVLITEDDSLYIKDYSILEIVMGTATPKNYSYIASYRVTVGSEVKSFTATTAEYGGISVSGTVTLKVEAVDSRGYSTSVTQNINVIDYADISINDYTIRRKNEVEPIVQLYFSGDMSPITISNVTKNYITYAKFRYAKNGEDWSGWSNLTIDDSGSFFEFVTTALSNSSGVIQFDPNSQYSIEIKVKDRLSEDSITIILNKGTPLMSFRAKKVGINTATPQAALDVNGDILMNGYGVIGFKGFVETDFNNYVENGLYLYTGSGASHAPTATSKSIILVFEYDTNNIFQLCCPLSDNFGIKIRSFVNSEWTPWW